MSYIPDGSETDKAVELQTRTGPSRVMKYGINIPLKPEEYFQEKEAHSTPGKTHPSFTQRHCAAFRGTCWFLLYFLRFPKMLGKRKTWSEAFYIIIKSNKPLFLSQTVSL